MDCEVLAIGTELLLGQIVDTNSAWMGEHLAAAGIACYQQTKVGDNHDRIVAAVRAALARGSEVICCGGLGPTQDDITREAIAEVMGVGLRREPDSVARLTSALPVGKSRKSTISRLTYRLAQPQFPRSVRRRGLSARWGTT